MAEIAKNYDGREITFNVADICKLPEKSISELEKIFNSAYSTHPDIFFKAKRENRFTSMPDANTFDEVVEVDCLRSDSGCNTICPYYSR